VAQLLRTDRRLELLERALAAAEESAALCAESTLVLASLLESVGNARMTAILFRGMTTEGPLIREAVAKSVHTRALELLHARFRAGTIFTPTADESTSFAAKKELPLLAGSVTFLTLASSLTHAPGIVPPRTPAEEEERLRHVHGALRLTRALDILGFFGRGDLGDVAALPTDCVIVSVSSTLLTNALRAEAAGDLLHRLRAVRGLSAAEEAELRALKKHIDRINTSDDEADGGAALDTMMQRFTDDRARHALRTCALPDCGQREREPKAFKVCARCFSAPYCCVAHQRSDWARHKHNDGCKKPAAGA
jgi:hypothetical protein